MALTPAQIANLKQIGMDIAEEQAKRVRPKPGNFHEVGQKVLEWAANPDAAPKSMGELKTEIGHLLNIPVAIKHIRFVQPGNDEYIIRLPNKDLAATAIAVMNKINALSDEEKDSVHAPKYPLPDFYDNFHQSGGTNPEMLEFFEMRVGDYTFKHCL